jgi:Ca2+-binding EF-hand superfamily protein
VKKTVLIFQLACASMVAAQNAAKPDASKDLAPALRKFDLDHDGKLTGDELKLARQAHNRGGRDPLPDAGTWKEMLQRQEKDFADRHRKDFDANGDGKLDDTERGEMREVWKQIAAKLTSIRDTIIAKYDRNDDGQLNDGERRASRDESNRLRREAEDQCLAAWHAKKAPPPASPAVPAPSPAPPAAKP